MAQDDNIKRWAMYAIIAFNITVVLFVFFYSLCRSGGIAGFHFMDFVVILMLGGIAGGGVFWACKKLNL